ncbi:MAG TPA: SAM-dependent methyltransferase [Acidimicrobiales bacterium]|nr:SAM-dependent methyltransferase [Acidimicrobiales bacterium]
MTGGSAAADLIRRRIHRAGPIGFDEFLELALYAPGAGFYEAGGLAGTRQGDFLTSPEVGPLFGAVLARALDTWWREMGEPDPFVAVEAAAGVGSLCRAVLDASPACAPALRYLLVERSEALRERQPAHVAVDPPRDVLGPLDDRDAEDDEGRRVLPGRGPRVASLAELPAGPLTGVVFANELLDNLPFALLERRPDGWREVRVGDDGAGGFTETLVEAPPSLEATATRLAPAAPPGARIPVQGAAADWVRDALQVLEQGRLVVIDYAVERTAELAHRSPGEWLRTYRGGGPGRGPLEEPGGQDVTCEVCVDQVARAKPLSSDRSQAEFLAAHGIADLVAAARHAWEATAAAPDVESLKARSRIGEAAALTDAAGLGAFRVLEWIV